MSGVPTQPVARPGMLLAGKLRLERVIGEGAMGIVYEATDTTLARKVAVKVIAADLLADQRQLRRFEREARAAARLKSEHAVRVLDVSGEGQAPYLAMEYLEGRTLEAIVTAEGRVAPAAAVDWVLQALDAIAEAHAQGLVHRDIKPANLFLANREGREPIVKVLDFGVVKDLDPTMTRITKTGAALGSPAYMAPEQVRALPDVDARADVWSIGVTLYELLTGNLPFDGHAVPDLLKQILEGEPEPLRAGRADVPEALEAIVKRCLAKDRRERYASAAELGEALEAAMAGPGGTVRLEPRRRVGREVPVTVPMPVPLAFAVTEDSSSGRAPFVSAPARAPAVAPAPAPAFAPPPPYPFVLPPSSSRRDPRSSARPQSGALVFVVALLAVLVLGALAIVALLVVARAR